LCEGVFLYTLRFNRPQRKESAGVRSGDLDGQRFFEIILFLEKLSISRSWHLKCDMLHRLVGNTQ